MNITTILGILFGMAVLGTATYHSTTYPEVFINVPGLAIVLGGTAAATFICYPFKEVMRVFSVFCLALGRGELPTGVYISRLVKIAKAFSAHGTMTLEEVIPTIKNQFLRNAMQMVVDGYNDAEIREILDTRIEQYYEQEMGSASIYRTMAKFSPAFGIIGTLIGLIGMLQSMGDLQSIGSAMATALTTTLYGILFANMIFIPIAVKVEKRIEERVILMSVIRDGILFINAKTPAAIVMDKLKAYLPPRRWASIDDAKIPEGTSDLKDVDKGEV